MKDILQSLATVPAVVFLRRYLIDRMSEIPPDELVKAIEAGDTDVVSKMSEEDKKILASTAVKFKPYLKYLTTRNVFAWLAEDHPFLAGIIYGHPKGIEFLGKVVSNIREEAERASIVLVPLGTFSKETG